MSLNPDPPKDLPKRKKFGQTRSPIEVNNTLFILRYVVFISGHK